MKFSVEKDLLLEALQKAQSIVKPKTPMPILSNVLIEAEEEGTLTLTTTDQEMSVRMRVPATVEEPGATTVPVRRLFGICHGLVSPQVDVWVSDDQVTNVYAGSFSGKLEGLSPEDFPPLPSFEESFSYEIDQGVLKGLLQKTAYAASTDESRAILNGSLLSFRENKLTVVCTDGRRLALAEQELNLPADAEMEVVAPTKTVNELIRTLDEEGSATIKASATQIAIEFGDTFIISKLIDGTYPNYRQVIPAQCEERLAIERETFLAAIQRVSRLLEDQASSVRLDIAENRIELLAFAPEIGEAKDVVPIKYSGEKISIAFNPAFLMAPLKHLESDEIYLELSDELSPGVIKSNVPFLYVIMPIRVA